MTAAVTSEFPMSAINKSVSILYYVHLSNEMSDEINKCLI